MVRASDLWVLCVFYCHIQVFTTTEPLMTCVTHAGYYAYWLLRLEVVVRHVQIIALVQSSSLYNLKKCYVCHAGWESADVWRFDTSTRRWERVTDYQTAVQPSARERHVMVSVGMDLWMHGGWTSPGEGDS